METRNLRGILAEHSFFKDLEDRHLDTVVGCASNVRFDAEQAIFRQGDSADHFFIIREGRVAVEIPGEGQPVIIQTLGPGDVLGWSWLIAPFNWRFDARAINDTRAIALDGACLRGKFDNDKELGYEMLKRVTGIMAQRIEGARIQILDIYGGRAA